MNHIGSVPHIVVIDPAMKTPETGCFNFLTLQSALPTTYHLPAILGMETLQAEDPALIRGFIVLGSMASVHDRAPWQLALEAWLKPMLERRIPTIGFCYGHQMLAHMYGGRIDFVFPDRKKHVGLREIRVEPTPAFGGGTGQLVVSHREMVAAPPAAMRIIATSQEIQVDGLAHRELPIFSYQSHPEATVDFLKSHAISTTDSDRSLSFGHRVCAEFLAYAAGAKSTR
jgi:GMP synthase (glutamine-hydrolysing)